MYQSFQTKLQSVGIQDSTSWLIGAKTSSSIYSIMCCMSTCKQYDDIFILLHKNALFLGKSNILCKWSNILGKFYVTMFKIYSLPTTWPAIPPGPPPHPAWHSTRPTTPPCQPTHLPASLASLLSHDGVTSVATR